MRFEGFVPAQEFIDCSLPRDQNIILWLDGICHVTPDLCSDWLPTGLSFTDHVLNISAKPPATASVTSRARSSDGGGGNLWVLTGVVVNFRTKVQ